MTNKFTAVIEKSGGWFVAYCPEVPGANGQGRSKSACLKNLSSAIALILEDRLRDGLRAATKSAKKEVICVSRQVKRGSVLAHLAWKAES